MMSVGRILPFAFLVSICSTLEAQSGASRPRIGEPAPALHLQEVLQAPSGAKTRWESLTGTPVVLEFWATWCGPCVANIPHFNELVASYSPQVRFISITDEDKTTVERFLDVHELLGWIGLDDEHRTFTDFRISSIPRTILVDAKGVVRAIAHPKDVTREVIDQLRDDLPLDLPDRSQSSMSLLHEAEITLDGPAPLMQAVVRPTLQAFRGTRQDPNRGTRSVYGVGPRELLQEMFGLTPPRMDVQAALPDQKYEANITATGRPDLRDDIAKLAILAAFGLEVESEERQLEVLVIEELSDREAKLRTAGAGGGSLYHGTDSDTGMSQIGGLARHDRLVRALETLSERPVVNEVLHQRYRVPLTEWPTGDIKAMREAMRANLGIDLKAETRPVQITVFRAVSR